MAQKLFFWGYHQATLWKRALVGGVSLLLLLGGVTGAFVRVAQLERAELDYEGETHTLRELVGQSHATRISARLDTVELPGGGHAVFEVCSQDRLLPERWQDALEFVVWRLDGMELMLRTPLDSAHLEVAKRSGPGACLALGGGQLTSGGRYAIDAVWLAGRPTPEVMQVGLNAHVLSRLPLGLWDKLFLLALACGAVLGVLIAYFSTLQRHHSRQETASRHARQQLQTVSNPWAREHLQPLFLGVACAAIVWGAAGWLPLWGSTMGLVKGLSIAAAEAGVAVWLARHLDPTSTRASALALGAPTRRPLLALAVAAMSACLLVLSARLFLQLVPATEVAPIQTFVAWPSGMLSFAALGVVVPVAEEVFFRGFVYRAALPLGKRAAFGITVLLFVAVHAQQTWGNWGSLAALLLTGLVLTGLRAWTGSTLVPAAAHLLYNLSLSASSL